MSERYYCQLRKSESDFCAQMMREMAQGIKLKCLVPLYFLHQVHNGFYDKCKSGRIWTVPLGVKLTSAHTRVAASFYICVT